MGLGYTYQAEVVSVYDGDTVHLLIECGLGVTLTGERLEGERCRLAGINAPELHSVGGSESQAALAAMLSIGSIVTVQTPKDKRDNYGRPLVTIIRSDGVDVNQAMLAAGQAVPYP
jgi:endonuclease YncB( thermonuclease family)